MGLFDLEIQILKAARFGRDPNNGAGLGRTYECASEAGRLKTRVAAWFGVLVVGAWSQCFAAALPTALTKVEREYARAGSIHANFTQKTWNESLQEEKISTGILMLKLPGKFRWEVRDPDPSLLISNGKTFWFYTPPLDASDRGEVWVNSAQGERWMWVSHLLAAHWSGVPGLKVKEKTPQSFELTIPAATQEGGLKTAEVFLSPTGKTIDRVRLEYRSKNRTEIGLSGIQLGKPSADALFSFDPPKGTVVHK